MREPIVDLSLYEISGTGLVVARRFEGIAARTVSRVELRASRHQVVISSSIRHGVYYLPHVPQTPIEELVALDRDGAILFVRRLTRS